MSFDINDYLRICRDQSLASINSFEKSSFVPKEDVISTLIKDLLVKLMGTNVPMEYKLTLSGPIVEQNKSEKKQSFCSEFGQMVKNIIGLIGFEYSKFLMFQMGAIVIAKNIISEMETDTSYEQLLQHLDWTYAILKPFPACVYELIYTPAKRPGTCSAIPGDTIEEFFAQERNELVTHISSKNITGFHEHKAHVIGELKSLIGNIKSCSRHIDTIDKLVIMNLGKYSVIYQGSFIKLFEILYKSAHADNPRFNDRGPQAITQYNVVEQYLNRTMQSAVRAETYVEYLNRYFAEIFYQTVKALTDDPTIKDDVEKVDIGLTASVTKSLAKITLVTLVKMAQLINKSNDSLRATASPSRVQFFVILFALRALIPGIDADYTAEQQRVLYYVLACEKVAKITKAKKKARDELKLGKMKQDKQEKNEKSEKNKNKNKFNNKHISKELSDKSIDDNDNNDNNNESNDSEKSEKALELKPARKTVKRRTKTTKKSSHDVHDVHETGETGENIEIEVHENINQLSSSDEKSEKFSSDQQEHINHEEKHLKKTVKHNVAKKSIKTKPENINLSHSEEEHIKDEKSEKNDTETESIKPHRVIRRSSRRKSPDSVPILHSLDDASNSTDSSNSE